MADGSDDNYWGLVTILGPLLLLAVIAWVVIRQRKQTPREEQRTEQGTRDVYAEEQRLHENDKSSGL